MPIAITHIKIMHKRVSTRFRSLNAFFSPPSCNACENTGINAEVNAPSPSKRRNKLGIVKPKTNADVISPAPKTRNITISRNAPTNRAIKITNDTALAFFKSPIVRQIKDIFLNYLKDPQFPFQLKIVAYIPILFVHVREKNNDL